MTHWVSFTAERLLYVDRGRDVIICDREGRSDVELFLGLTDAQVEKLRGELKQATGEE